MAKTPVKSAPRARRAKAEVQEEFQQIVQEREEVRETADRKGDEARALRHAEVREAVDGVSVEGVIDGVSKLGLEITRSLAEISTQLNGAVQMLATVREAVAIERAELERLHKIDVAATALDQMLDDYRQQQTTLEADITARKAAWKREADDFEYNKTLERKRAQDRYNEEQRQLERKNAEKQETLEKGWALREAALKEKETEFHRLKKEADEFPARLEREVKRAAEESARATQARLEQAAQLAQKDAEGDKRLGELRVKTLETALEHQTAQIASLEKQLAEAKQQVQDIAVKAIEGASGARALSHVNQIAIEQAKNRPQS